MEDWKKRRLREKALAEERRRDEAARRRRPKNYRPFAPEQAAIRLPDVHDHDDPHEGEADEKRT